MIICDRCQKKLQEPGKSCRGNICDTFDIFSDKLICFSCADQWSKRQEDIRVRMKEERATLEEQAWNEFCRDVVPIK